MDYELFANTGVRVSELSFGTMSFGDTADEAESKRMFDACLNAGINLFDCANVYAKGRSEEILGDLMQGMRDELIITSKVQGKMGADINDGGLSRRHIVKAIEDSLKRLKTDRLDIYFVHKFDNLTAIEETLRALDDLVKQGLVLYLGVSNWAAWQIAKALGISAHEQLSRFQVIQPMYNLVKRQAEVELLPLALSENLAVVPYNPLGAGLLTGKYSTTSKPEQGRLVENSMYNKRYQDHQNYEIAERFVAYAKEKNVNPVTLAVAWVKAHPAITSPIIGARNAEQLKDSLAAADFDMSDEMYKDIASLSPEPPPATDRTEERL